jgi:hypothetical protein
MSTFGLGNDRLGGWGDVIHSEDRLMAQQAYFNAMRTNKGYSVPLEMRVVDVSKEEQGHYLDVCIHLLSYFFLPDATAR